MRVLHVSEALGGGVTSAVTAMVEATPEIDHHLYARPRHQHDVGIDTARHFASVHPMSGNPAVAIGELRALVREMYPDVVHAHSSVAGVVVRMAGLDLPSIVYSPHCFAFERRDVSGLARRAFRTIERVLAPRTDLLLAVAPHEMDLAAEIGHHALAYVPNRATIVPRAHAEFRSPMRIVTVGRVCAQKDWRYLVHLKRFVDDQIGLDATWEWLGDGDESGVRELDDAGIDVSGWIDRTEVLDRLTEAQVYVHTAAWEAAPISILEAASLGLPLAIRSEPALDSLALPGLARGVGALAARLEALANEPAWVAAQDASLALAGRHSAEAQAQHLLRAYDRAIGGTPAVSLVPTGGAAGFGVVDGVALRRAGSDG
ncbi:glycosyltransferase [Aeromicrobium sp. Leaf350]|uniref:glycosyltransferase n=1 Tax=Aeromicrobium sp. Leaf350 TaxID=2876565 RepID=UPI001E2DF77B|nr:glycosyltransferase [Aeromicrobium sp. Leaf350]